MDVQTISYAYVNKTPLEQILQMYQECPLDAVSTSNGKQTLLHVSVQNAHPEALEYLLANGADPNEPGGYGEGTYPIFMLANVTGSSHSYTPRAGDIYKTTCLLLDARATTIRKDDEGLLCFHHAAKCGNHEFLQACLEKGVKLTKADDDGNTGLHLAAEGTYNPVKDLERAEKALQEKKDGKNTPVSLEEFEARVAQATEKVDRFFKTAHIFMEAGTDIDAQNNMLEKAHALATRHGARKMAALLDGSYVAPSAENGISEEDAELHAVAGGMSLHQAVLYHDEKAVKALLALGADVNEFSDDEKMMGHTPLSMACSYCNVELARLLLENGADPNLKLANGSTPLSFLFGTQLSLHSPQNLYRDALPRKMVRLFAENGADLNSTVNADEDTLLILACRVQGGGGGRDTVRFMVADELCRLGIDVNYTNRFGITSAMHLCLLDISEGEDVLITLLENDANLTQKDMGGNNILHYVASNTSLHSAAAFCELLFDVNPDDLDVNAVNNDGKTPLEYATENNNEVLVKFLLEHM